MFVSAASGHTAHMRWMRHEMARRPMPERLTDGRTSERLLGEARAQGVGYGRMHEL